MIKLITYVDINKCSFGGIKLDDPTLIIGSCFADTIGQKMLNGGFNVMINPFGTLYNPMSISNALARICSNAPFTEDECVQMGSGSELICSFSHHTSFARKTKQDFLLNANQALLQANQFFTKAKNIIITLGTAWCFSYNKTGQIVSNCLKIDAKQFIRQCLSLKTVSTILNLIADKYSDKKIIFTVSPIRHLKDGAHGNQLSKSTLLLSIDDVVTKFNSRVDYFPSYEIVLDELRDYRFFADDLVHPSNKAVDIIWEKFCNYALTDEDKIKLSENEKQYRALQHRCNTIE